MTIASNHILTIVLGTLQLLVALVLSLSYRSNKNVNIFLIILVIYGTIKSFYIGVIQDGSEAYLNNSFSWIKLLGFFTIPSGYLYLKTLVNTKNNVSTQALIHFTYPVFWALIAFLQATYIFVPEDIWQPIRKVNIIGYIFFYAVISVILVKEFYKNRHHDSEKTLHYNEVHKWIFVFLFFMILINIRALIHFCFDLHSNLGLFAQISKSVDSVFWFLILIKVLTTPEILYGYLRLRKSLASDPISKIENKLVKLNGEFHLKNKRLEDYFEGETLDCLLILVNSNNEFVQLNNLDDLFVSEYRSSLPTVKKRRDLCLKDIKYQLSVQLDVPIESIFIVSQDTSDKRIKHIKINPEYLKIA